MRAGRNVRADDSARRDDGALADDDAGMDCRSFADRDLVADDGRAV